MSNLKGILLIVIVTLMVLGLSHMIDESSSDTILYRSSEDYLDFSEYNY